MIKLVAMDLDGTLLNADRRVSEENAEALRACEARGVKMVLASGRSFQSVRRLAKEIGLTSPIISSNGAKLDESPDGPTLLEDVFPLDVSKQVYSILKESGIYFVCYGRDALYRNNLQSAAEAGRGLNAPPKTKSENDAFIVTTIDDEDLMISEGIHEPLKYVAFTHEADKLAALRETLTRQTDCALSSSWFDNVEVLIHGAGKGKAIRTLCAHYGIAKEETMAFGDNLNDLDMLEAVGVPVAMENAIDALKRIATLIAPHHDASGVGTVLREKVLSQEVVRA